MCNEAGVSPLQPKKKKRWTAASMDDRLDHQSWPLPTPPIRRVPPTCHPSIGGTDVIGIDASARPTGSSPGRPQVSDTRAAIAKGLRPRRLLPFSVLPERPSRPVRSPHLIHTHPPRVLRPLLGLITTDWGGRLGFTSERASERKGDSLSWGDGAGGGRVVPADAHHHALLPHRRRRHHRRLHPRRTGSPSLSPSFS